jgi:hypothetical protein
MTDGCWVQFWDDKACVGATLRFDATSGTLLVSDLDDYTQSDGSKEGDEPDSLATGSRAWLVVYKDDSFEGRSAMFGPNTRVEDLDLYDLGGNISSFKLYDYRPSWFNETATGGPIAYEASEEAINASTVNNVFRTVVGAALTFVPGVGSALSILVRGLWPDVDQRDQVWGSFQNYLNQSVAGVYWQLTYESLNSMLETMYTAAKEFVEIPVEDHDDKAKSFDNLYTLVNNYRSFFIDEQTPEKRYSFLVPFATLRLAALQENINNYVYYHDEEPSQTRLDQLTTELRDSIALYQRLLVEARDRIIDRRSQMIFVEDDSYLIDLYTGGRMVMAEPKELDSRKHYVESVTNTLALRLDEHNAVGQLWSYFDPDVTGPVEPPVLDYATGPYGYYWYGVPAFSQMTEQGRVTGLTLWTELTQSNGAQQKALEVFIDGIGRGRVGGDGGTAQSLTLTGDERFDYAEGGTALRYLCYGTNDGRRVTAGDPNADSSTRFVNTLLADSLNTTLMGISGAAGLIPGEPATFACVRCVSMHWRCQLALAPESESAPRPAREPEMAD